MESHGTDKEFEAMVATAYDRLPEWIKKKMKNVAITVEDFVDTETVHEMGLESYMDLLGFYRGVPLTERTVGVGFEMPDTIVLYRMPILEESSESGKPVADIVYETLWHEIAHHFGLTEEDVRKREDEEFGNDVY
ncbi:MAG TPA: metallopeptidase family protein [Candidatus Paceibacterota bacterium]|nr:metallopeptidase family protein [Candidatus Paceibacterota bacterium]